MTLEKFLQKYGGNECVNIEGYCEELRTEKLSHGISLA